MVSVCLPSDALLQHLPSYLGFSYLGWGVSPQHRPSWPWTWNNSSRPSCTRAATAPWAWDCSMFFLEGTINAKVYRRSQWCHGQFQGLHGIVKGGDSLYWKWKVKVKSLSRVWLLATPWTAAYKAPRSMVFSRQSTGVGCHCLLWFLPSSD